MYIKKAANNQKKRKYFKKKTKIQGNNWLYK